MAVMVCHFAMLETTSYNEAADTGPLMTDSV